jgi:pSer/pThr/pTyr-binding forkhead associated (FHA) protein/tetratricopeptide (TPR) repeat protein
MKKYLLITSGDTKKSVPLIKDRIVLGRDKESDVVLIGENISRQHAAIISSFGNYYIENLSGSSPILRNNEAIEYVEIKVGDVVKMDDYELRIVDSEKAAESAKPEPEAAPSSAELAEVSNVASPQILAEPEPAGFEFAAVSSDAPGSGDNLQAPQADGISPATIPSIDQNKELDLGALVPINSTEGASQIISTQFSESPTRIVEEKEKYAVLKVTKGEQVGREIRLDHGLQWTIGRGNEVEVQVDNPKLSRAHFKIVKIAQGYRLQDLGSSNGTRLNGVAVTDAPLQVFDAIKAGPVELQFLIVDPSQRGSLASEALAIEGTNSQSFSEKTAFSPPQPYVAAMNNSSSASGEGMSVPRFNMPNSSEESFVRNVEGSIQQLNPRQRIIIWWKEQPKPRRALIGVALLLLLLIPFLASNPKEDAQATAAALPTDPSATQNAASKAVSPLEDSSDVSPEFNLKSEDEKRRIQELYAKAQQAKARQDWKTAFESASEILKEVKKYKNAADILDEAQTYLNENQIGSLSRSLSAIESAKESNQTKVQALLESGEKAIREGRWEDAQESFTKALTLDPDSEAAKQGFAAAHAKDPNVVITTSDIPKEIPAANDPAAAERDSMTELERNYQAAKLHIHEGQFRKAIPLLNQLEPQVSGKMDGFEDQNRTPASVREELLPRSKALMSSIREARDRINSEFRMEYQGLMSDAEIAISNKQYIQAREIYDNIIRKDSEYTEAVEARRKLYKLIINEAKNMYQEGLIYESVSDVPNAVDSYEKTVSLLDNIEDYSAKRYFEKAGDKLKVLKR